MPRHKGVPNKITATVKERLQKIIDDVINSIDVDTMDTAEKLKFLQLALHYVVPKLRAVLHHDQEQEEDLPFIIDIHKRDPETDEWVHEIVESSMPASVVKENRDKWQ